MSLPYTPRVHTGRQKGSHESLTSEVYQRGHNACNMLADQAMQAKTVDEHDEM